jgi:cysteinyl-tRNA synthetase
MELKAFNSLGRKVEPIERRDGAVGLYTCGPTVYNYLHVGNYRTYVFEDVLKRTMKLLGYKVRHVMNITDVGHLTSQADEGEDKMAVAARREGKTAWDIAKFYEKTFLDDIARLKIDFAPTSDAKVLRDCAAPGDILCRATEHVPEQIELVRRLEAKGLTYEIPGDGVYFDTAKYNAAGGRYERLIGGAHVEGLQEGARVAANEGKRSRTDFALWKFSKKGERQMEWDFPGKPAWWGFPGWHIECSAMAMKYLGETFDVHCGGVDHIPIHHTNEIAQTEGATGRPFVRIWMHGEFLLMNKAKMAKSSGGFIRLQDLAERGFDPLDFRYFCYTAHYRKQLDFSWEALEAAKVARRRLVERFRELPEDGAPAAAAPLEEFRSRLADDLDMPGATAAVWKAAADKSAGTKAFLAAAESVLALGLGQAEPAAELPAAVAADFESYKAARAKKDFAASDALRKKLAESGYKVLDSKEGSRVQRA